MKQINLFGKEFNPSNEDEIALSVFNYAKKRGFPHYNLTKDEMVNDFNKLKKYDISNIIDEGKYINQTLHCMGLCWSYFPHHWEIRTRKMRTPMDVWNNDQMFISAIKSRIKWGGRVGENGYMSDSNLRKALRTFSGVQRVSNFRPSAAAGIYYHYCESDSVVWDMSSGFGGRLIGAIISGKVKKYIGCDPSTPTFDGLNKMAKDFPLIEIDLNKIGSEDFIPNSKVDLCFTSPPYFNTEVYSEDKEQSCHKFSDVEKWNEGFLRKTINNCRKSLKSSGKLILNVANVSSHKLLEKNTVNIANDEGFELVETLHMKLSSISKGGHKFEPVFVFKLK